MGRYFSGLLALGLLCLGGCASAPDQAELPVEPPPAFSTTGAAPAQADWWMAFGDAQLERIMQRALRHNLTLAAARERLLAASALARRERAELFPEVDATGSVDYETGDSREDETTYGIGLAASYEVDLWGRIDAQVRAEDLRKEATAAEVQTMALSLTGEVSLTWFRLLEARAQQGLLEKQIAANDEVLSVLDARFKSGAISRADVLRQKQLVESTRESLLIAGQEGRLREHQLATLLGEPPQNRAEYENAALPELPPLPATGIPAEVLQRRPDVREAWLRMQVLDSEVAAAVSAQYPRLNLLAGLETTAEKPANLFEDWLGSITAQLVAPLFDAGERRAEVRRTAALQREALMQYGETVLNALREVEDFLVREQTAKARVENLRSQVRLADQTYDLLRDRYMNGTADYISTLTALTQLQRLQRDQLSAQLSLLEARVGLYRSLSGGFEDHHEQN